MFCFVLRRRSLKIGDVRHNSFGVVAVVAVVVSC